MKLRPDNLPTASSRHWLMGVYCKINTPKARCSTTDRRSSGFTLIELLVALLVSGIITTLVLGFVVDLMRNNQREASRSNTQREMQAAIDYINRDVREAVYVYDGECLRTTGTKVLGAIQCPGILPSLPAGLNTGTNLPVLAFWRLDPLPDQVQTACRANAREITTNRTSPFAALPCVAGKMYTLVVYSLNRDNPGNIWKGRSRITRYTLPQFTEGGGTNPLPGWYSPLVNGWPTWPLDPRTNLRVAGATANNIAGNNQVLVDFVDNQTNDADAGGAPNAANAAAVCPSVSGVAAEAPGGFYASPASAAPLAATNLSRRSFYACVRGGEAASLNQEVIVRIQGNAAGQPGLTTPNSSLPITMETRILTRGVLGKT
jgi:prepilin-type N-terminal cleavage/methylation domain-containing protein